MQAIILAAGQSSRFVPFSSIAHKSLITMMGKTLLEHTLLSLKKAGVSDVVIVVGKDSPIENIIGDESSLGIHIRYVTQSESQGMGDALLQAEDFLQEEFFLLHAYHLEFHEFAKDMMKKKKDTEVVLLGKELLSSDRYGYMNIQEDRVTGIIEKPDKILDNSLHIIGIYLLNKSFLNTLKKIPVSHYHFEEALDAYAKDGKVTYLKTEKKSLTLKYSWDLLSVQEYLLSQIDHTIAHDAEVSKHAILTGNIHIEPGAKVLEGACIKGPSYIGKNVIVGNNALLRNGVIAEEGSVIGSYMEVKNTFLMQEATTHAGFIGDSVIGKNCKIGTDMCTTNVRLDRDVVLPVVKEKKVHSYRNHLGVIIGNDTVIGARVTTMPGVIIGNNSFIGPSSVIMKNIDDNTRFFTEFKSTTRILPNKPNKSESR